MNTQANTSISVGLLSTPVKLYNAISKLDEICFSYCGPGGEALERVYRTKADGEVIDHENLRKSYEGKMIDVAKLAAIEEASLKDEDGEDLRHIRIDHFMPLKDVPFYRADNLYYIGPNTKISIPDSFNALVAGMKKRKVAGVAKVVLKKRQKLFVLFVKDEILYGASLHFAANVVEPEHEKLVVEKKVQKAAVDLMCQQIDLQMGNGLDDMEDTFVARKRELVEQALEGAEVVAPEETRTTDAHDLIEALEESVKQTAAKVKA